MQLKKRDQVYIYHGAFRGNSAKIQRIKRSKISKEMISIECYVYKDKGTFLAEVHPLNLKKEWNIIEMDEMHGLGSSLKDYFVDMGHKDDEAKRIAKEIIADLEVAAI